MFLKPLTITEDQENLLLVLGSPPYPQDVTEGLLKAMYVNNWSLKQIFPELPHEAFEHVYMSAKKYYEAGDYNAALPIFYGLVAYNHHSYKYIIGCAACLHLLGYYKEAAQGYALAYAAAPANPIPLFYAAECVEKLKSYEVAILLLKQAIAISDKRKEYSVLKEKAQLILAGLEKQLAGEK